MKEIDENEVLNHVQKLLEEQTLKGLEKYGHTVNPKEYDVVGWIDHLQQELIDALVYSTIIKMRDAEDVRQGMLEDLYAENKRYREALEFYADEDNYIIIGEKTYIGHGDYLEETWIEVDRDNGKTARKALEDSK